MAGIGKTRCVMNNIHKGAYFRERTLSMWEGGGPEGFEYFSKKFVVQETIDLNIS